MTSQLKIRTATAEDHPFIMSLADRLASVAQLPWHRQADIDTMQSNYMHKMLQQTGINNITLIAEYAGQAVGFIHGRESNDGISDEPCATVPLLAVTEAAQGLGVAKQLMQRIEQWSSKQGYRLLQLEVFANNSHAQGFYQYLGFQAEMINMVKQLK